MSWAIVVSVHVFSIPSMSQISSCAVEAGELAASCSQQGKRKNAPGMTEMVYRGMRTHRK